MREATPEQLSEYKKRIDGLTLVSDENVSPEELKQIKAALFLILSDRKQGTLDLAGNPITAIFRATPTSAPIVARASKASKVVRVEASGTALLISRVGKEQKVILAPLERTFMEEVVVAGKHGGRPIKTAEFKPASVEADGLVVIREDQYLAAKERDSKFMSDFEFIDDFAISVRRTDDVTRVTEDGIANQLVFVKKPPDPQAVVARDVPTEPMSHADISYLYAPRRQFGVHGVNFKTLQGEWADVVVMGKGDTGVRFRETDNIYEKAAEGDLFFVASGKKPPEGAIKVGEPHPVERYLGESPIYQLYRRPYAEPHFTPEAPTPEAMSHADISYLYAPRTHFGFNGVNFRTVQGEWADVVVMGKGDTGVRFRVTDNIYEKAAEGDYFFVASGKEPPGGAIKVGEPHPVKRYLGESPIYQLYRRPYTKLPDLTELNSKLTGKYANTPVIATIATGKPPIVKGALVFNLTGKELDSLPVKLKEDVGGVGSVDSYHTIGGVNYKVTAEVPAGGNLSRDYRFSVHPASPNPQAALEAALKKYEVIP